MTPEFKVDFSDGEGVRDASKKEMVHWFPELDLLFEHFPTLRRMEIVIGERVGFQVGDILKCTSGRYKGNSVEVRKTHTEHDPCLYTCYVYNHEDKKMVEVALYERELESIYEHDMRAQRLWKEMIDEKKER